MGKGEKKPEKPAETPRQQLMRARIYRYVGYMFAIVGLFVFFGLFIQNYKGDIMMVSKEPGALFIILIPVFPALVFFFLSNSTESKALAVLEKDDKTSCLKKRSRNNGFRLIPTLIIKLRSALSPWLRWRRKGCSMTGKMIPMDASP